MSLDDRHVYDKHNQIYPSKSELDAFEKIVGVTEKVLKKLSDKFVNEDYPITSPEAKQGIKIIVFFIISKIYYHIIVRFL